MRSCSKGSKGLSHTKNALNFDPYLKVTRYGSNFSSRPSPRKDEIRIKIFLLTKNPRKDEMRIKIFSSPKAHERRDTDWDFLQGRTRQMAWGSSSPGLGLPFHQGRHREIHPAKSLKVKTKGR